MDHFKRIIPCLLLSETGFVKTKNFKNPVYLGDPINIVNIFNEKGIDELIILDINARRRRTGIDYALIERIASEAFVPLCYGGGIQTLDEAKRILSLGIEKISINTSALVNSQFIRELADHVGSQSIVVSIDIKKNIFGHYKIYSHAKIKTSHLSYIEYAKMAERMGAGEILLNSVDNDGLMSGYDLSLIASLSQELTVPLVACGGASSLKDIQDLFNKTQVDGAAAGSLFVFQGPHRAVLISYPNGADRAEYNL